jgi:hypothetical protein
MTKELSHIAGCSSPLEPIVVQNPLKKEQKIAKRWGMRVRDPVCSETLRGRKNE